MVLDFLEQLAEGTPKSSLQDSRKATIKLNLADRRKPVGEDGCAYTLYCIRIYTDCPPQGNAYAHSYFSAEVEERQCEDFWYAYTPVYTYALAYSDLHGTSAALPNSRPHA